ncbi:MAG: Kazal-type serine protease inhibitor domain-containing protein [Polyangiaceae bacterium]
MNRRRITLACAALVATACGGTTAGVEPSANKRISTLDSLASGATHSRAYLGTDDRVAMGAAPALATLGLLGGGQIELEVVTPDGSPVRFEVWRARGDGTATLEIPVNAASGFALEEIDPQEDGTWAILFPGAQRGTAIVHLDCVAGPRGCMLERQPGQLCPAGWDCDEGLECELPVGVCGPLAGTGTCVARPSFCQDDAESVCGCDGRTYSSQCAARLAGAQILRRGSCES